MIEIARNLSVRAGFDQFIFHRRVSIVTLTHEVKKKCETFSECQNAIRLRTFSLRREKKDTQHKNRKET